MYQANFPLYQPPPPTPGGPSLVLPPLVEPFRNGFRGILAERGLARFMLARIPVQSPASQATCPYIPFKEGFDGFAYPPHTVDTTQSQSQLTVKVVDTYDQKQAPIVGDQEILTPIPPVDQLDARPFKEDFIAGKDDGIPATPLSGTDALPAQPFVPVHQAPVRDTGTAITREGRPVVLNPPEPVTAPPTATQLPTRVVECR